MAYQVTITNIKNNPNSPSFSDWLDSLAGSNLLDARYPECIGTAPSDIVTTMVTEKIENPAAGFISVENTETTYTTLWESKEAYENALKAGRESVTSHDTTILSGTITIATNTPTVVGVGTTFLTDAEVGGYIHHINGDNQDVTLGLVQSIESDTSLTLEDNPEYTAEGITYHVEPKISVLAFLQQRYHALHPVTTTIDAVEI